MALVPVGEHGVTISINGTERINDQIRDDTTYNLNESFNTKINVNGNQRVNTTQNSDETYNITESLNSTINVNGSNEGTFSQTSDSTYDVSVSGSPSNIVTHTQEFRLNPRTKNYASVGKNTAMYYAQFPPDIVRVDNVVNWSAHSTIGSNSIDIYKNGNQIVDTGSNGGSGTFTATESDDVRVGGYSSEDSRIYCTLSYDVYTSFDVATDSVNKS